MSFGCSPHEAKRNAGQVAPDFAALHPGYACYQLVKPDFTARTIFRIADPNAVKIVSELGFGNIAIGALGVLTIVNATWIVPAAITMAIFTALAGVKPVMNVQRTTSENWAMGSDLGTALVLVGWFVAVWVGP